MSQARTTLLVPDVPAGLYSILACADDLGQEEEADDQNNCRASSKQMSVGSSTTTSSTTTTTTSSSSTTTTTVPTGQAPETSITSAPPPSTTLRNAELRFISTLEGATFECRLDDAVFTSCQSPLAYTNLPTGGHSFAVRARSPGGVADASPAVLAWTISPEPPLPPDPTTVAPPARADVATNLSTATAFLYGGPNPIQTGVAPGAIEPRRVAVLKGTVRDRSGAGIPGVDVAVKDHPEFGQTTTRVDGAYDLAGSGGGVLTLTYGKPGLLSAHRQVTAPWQDYAVVADLVMVHYDPKTSSVNLGSTGVQVAAGTPETDADGTRQAAVLFHPGTTAKAVLPNGTTQDLNQLTVRLTEFTVGDTGPATMPAALPPSSRYTDALDMAVDEAEVLGAHVAFSQPVTLYVDNFIGFPVGSPVPFALYNERSTTWEPVDSGLVVGILSEADGLAELDLDGTGQPAAEARYAALGITAEERAGLATTRDPGTSLWRQQVPHFSTGDANWGGGPPDDADDPDPGCENGASATSGRGCRPLPPRCSLPGNSTIGCENQTLAESLPVVGTPYTLNYTSDRQPGHTATANVRFRLHAGDRRPRAPSVRTW